MATVLVVDDRATNRELVRTLLCCRGHRVIEAAEGVQALDLAHAEHPDLVVTDVLMPGMDGYELALELRAAPDTARTPIVFYTATFLEDEARPLAEACGVARVLHKTADPQLLLQAVDEVLGEDPRPAVVGAGDFVREHRRAVNAKLVEKAQALSESENRFRTVTERSPVGIFFGDARGEATYANPRLAQILRAPTDGLLGRGWLACITADQHDEAMSIARGLADHDVERRYRNPVVLPDGSQRWLNVYLQTIRFEDGTLSGFVGMVDDVTPVVETELRHRAEERRRDVEARDHATERLASLSRLAGGVAHDFNNILGVILVFEELLAEALTDLTRDGRLDEKTGQSLLGDLAQIRKAGNRATELTQQLLTVGSRKVIDVTPVDVERAVHEMMAVLGPTLGTQTSVDVNLGRDLLRVLAEPSNLTQILLNLTLNARQAMADGGALTIEAANHGVTEELAAPAGVKPGRYVRLRIRDTGTGMTAEVLNRAVEPFFTTRPRGEAAGMGLATVYGIVTQLGGDLRLESAPQCGTVVTVLLPATDQPAEPPPAGRGRAAGGTETILLAEDEEGLREGVARTLRGAGYTVLAAADGPAALALAEQHTGPIDLLLTDVMMPGMLGSELAAQLVGQRRGLPVLFMSGYAGDLMNRQGMLESGITVLPKPFTDTDLLQAIRSALAATHL